MKALICALALWATFIACANAAVVNSAGTAGVCVSVTSGAVVTVLAAKPLRPNVTIYTTQPLNCEPGSNNGGAPTVTPTTGAIGTGAGFPFVASQYISIGGGRSIPLTATGNLFLDPGARLDCIAQSATASVCSWEGE